MRPHRQGVTLAKEVDLGTNLPALLERLAEVDEGREVKWEIRQLAPRWFVEFREPLRRFVDEGRIDEFLCSIQSGSERILERMNRHVNLRELEETLEEFRRLRPDLMLKTDVIVGFPSETEGELLASVDYPRRIPFDQVRLFAYSEVDGTRASRMEGKIEKEVILDRLRRARRLLEASGIVCIDDDDNG